LTVVRVVGSCITVIIDGPPRARLGSLAICAGVICSFATTMTGLIPYPLLAALDPLAGATDAAGLA
jgi:hypothetical protein